MKKNHLLPTLVLISVAAWSAAVIAQSVVAERNVRAGMEFLAGDAMQGRGSGTKFERIAAEYVGSQFMQFGLEPADETGYHGTPTFVQTVTFARQSFAKSPRIKIGDSVLEYGKDVVVLRANTGAVSGPLQKITLGEKAKAGSVVFATLRESDRSGNINLELQSLLSQGAVMVIVEETPRWRSNWASMAARRVTYTVSAGAVKSNVTVVASKDAAAEISKLPDGTMVEFGGTLAPVQTSNTWNAIGNITGSDKTLGSEVIVLSAHLDHLGERSDALGDDKIFNGADDDASGTVAVMELARVLTAGKRPKRTIYFVCFGSEEGGGHGSNYFVSNLPFPKEKLVANLQFEMIGRPDAKVKPDQLWLTGYELSNLGPELARNGAKLVADPHPEENFFQRSDNYRFAQQGIVAHTVSSFGLHTDYHRASDELDTIDFAYMTRAINSMTKPIAWLANSNFRPSWNEGKRP